MTYLDEAQLELATVDYFRELGYKHIHGAYIAPDLPAPRARQAGVPDAAKFVGEAGI